MKGFPFGEAVVSAEVQDDFLHLAQVMSPEPSAEPTWEAIGVAVSESATQGMRDESPVAAAETQAAPDVTEDEADDAGVEVGRVRRRRR